MDIEGFKIYHNAISLDLIRECRDILPSILSNKKYINNGVTFLELYKNKPHRFPNIGLDQFDDRELFIICNPCEDYAEFRKLLTSNALWRFAARCFGRPIDDVAFSFLNITRKPAKFGPSISWHRDFGNKMTSTKSSRNMLRIIVPLDSSGTDNGGISVIPGSNKLEDGKVLAGEGIDVDYCNKNNEVISLNAGDMLAISSKIIHGGAVNRSNRDRNHVIVQFVIKGSEHLYQNQYLYENQDEPYYGYGLSEIRHFLLSLAQS